MSRNTITFEEGKKVVDGRGDYAYNVKIGTSVGDLMSKEDYTIGVEDEYFTNADGYGNMLNDAGEYLGGTCPHRVDELDSKCAYVLWFNK
jgi:hypothetical protein